MSDDADISDLPVRKISAEDAMADAREVAFRMRTEGKEKRQAEFLEHLATGITIGEACKRTGIQNPTYSRWRERDRQFAARADAIRAEAREQRKAPEWDGGFADFRIRYLGHQSPWFHLDIINRIESMTDGEIGLVLMPPEHGKTTLLEDYATFKLCVDPDYRICIGSEKVTHGAKVMRQIKVYMDPDQPGAKREMIARFGPFKDPDSDQLWHATAIEVAKRSGEQRDPSIQAIGIRGAMQGNRIDLLIIDDTQGRKSLDQTAYIIQALRQDWFSRTGAFGKVVIIGTRVGPTDVYQELLDENLCDWVVQYGAFDDTVDRWDAPDRTVAAPKKHPVNVAAAEQVTTFLWPERYGPQQYLIMRFNAGEEPWARNYMQKSRGAKGGPFSEELLEFAGVPDVSVLHQPGQPHTGLADARAVAVLVDPGFGKNATMAMALHPRWCMPIAWRVDEGLENNQAIIGLIDEYLHRYTEGSRRWARWVVVETKAFQKGLAKDEAIKRTRSRFGVKIVPHDTGTNKYDPDFGVGAMAEAMLRGEVRLPGGNDTATLLARELLDKQLLAWRPGKRGTKLVQDLTMTLWFGFILWRNVRRTLEDERKPIAQGLQTAGLPWAPTSTGLLVPTGR